MARILLLNGPNLNLLGTREPAIYGSDSLPTIEAKLERMAKERGHDLLALQTNAAYQTNSQGQPGATSVSLLSRAKIKF